MDRLPSELVRHVFSFLDDVDLCTAAKTCSAFAGVVAACFWHRRLQDLWVDDAWVRQWLERSGWQPDSAASPVALTIRLYLKLEHSRKNNFSKPKASSVEEVAMMCYTPGRFVERMPADFVIYGTKGYVGLKNTAIQVSHILTLNTNNALNAI